MSEAVRLQDPTAGPVAHTFDWTDYLGTKVITGSTWSIEPTGPVLSGAALASPLTTTRISGIVFGGIYRVINTVTLDSTEVDARSFELRGFSE